jgi:hypothetical protein
LFCDEKYKKLFSSDSSTQLIIGMKNLQEVPTKTKLIALWATPRSVSTAFEKTFSQRSDTQIVHEPFCDVYYFSKWRVSDRFGDWSELENYSSSEAGNKINASYKDKSVSFIKDHAYDVLPYVEPDFFKSLTNTFIRMYMVITARKIGTQFSKDFKYC